MIRGWHRSEVIKLCVAAILLPCLALLQVGLNGTSEQREMQESTPFEELPPDEFMMEYVGSILLGGFRAIAVDFLWLRVDRLQREKKWDEMRAVCQAIARLQPRQSEVYAHLGWNMAYNISNQFEEPEEKIKWIRAGIEYVERGARKNPLDERMAFWLGYIYWHRVPRAEHTLAPESEQRVLDLMEAQNGECAYETAIRYLQRAQRLYDSMNPDNNQIPFDKYEGLVVDAMFHIAYHRMGDCGAPTNRTMSPQRWEAVQTQFDTVSQYIRYVDTRYMPGTTFWNDRIQYVHLLQRIIELERDVETIRAQDGLQASLPATWAAVSAYKALKAGKALFRQGSLERRMRRLVFSVCEAGYERLGAGDLAGAQQLWDQVVTSCQTRHLSGDPYQSAWQNWGDGVKRLREALPIEARMLAAVAARDEMAARQAAREAHAIYGQTLEDNGLMELPLFVERARRLKETAGD